jgi:small multidrug resistance pump
LEAWGRACRQSESRSFGQTVILALKRLDLSVVYAIWSGVGTALATMIGIAYFHEPLTLFKMGSVALVILGLAGLGLAGRQ